MNDEEKKQAIIELYTGSRTGLLPAARHERLRELTSKLLQTFKEPKKEEVDLEELLDA